MSDEICVPEEIHLPNEILENIINKLASDPEDNDRTLLAALTSCRLASHLLYSVATPLLFSSIQLIFFSPDNDTLVAFQERATKLKQILSTSDIAASVHTLTLRCQNEILENEINGTLISAIIYRLPHIRTFILESKGDRLALTGDLESAITALCRSPSLTTLDLDNIADFPITFITACHLRSLRLSWVSFSFDHPNPIDETSILQPYSLDSLEIDHYGLRLLDSCDSDFISFAKHFSRIKNLRLRHFFSDEATLKCGWDIMLLASQSLITLDLPRNEGWYSSVLPRALKGDPFNLSRFPALRHFKIQIRISFWENLNMLSFMNQLLSVSSSTSGIETLEIMISWIYVESGCAKDLFSSDAGWSTLDEVLSSEKYVSLQKVVLSLEIWGCDLELERRLALPYINTLFPTFRALTSAQRTLELHVDIRE